MVWFLIAIAFGLGAGLLAGWVLFPPAGSADAAPESLRADYQADYVLMTAEIFAGDGSAAGAAERLRFLGDERPLHYVEIALLTGQELGYTQADMQLLVKLFTALEGWSPALPSITP